MLHSGMPTYEQQHHPHAQHAAHKPAWPQPIMQPLQVSNDQVIKTEPKVKQEIKTEPLVSIEPPGPSVIAMHTSAESHSVIDASVTNSLNDDPPKIKIKTDLFKEAEASNQIRRGVITESGEIEKAPGSNAEMQIRQSNLTEVGRDGVNKSNEIAAINKDIVSDPNLDMLGGVCMVGDVEGGKSRISDSGNSTDSANKNKFQGFSASESSSSSSEDETKIPNEIYFGTPDISTYRPKMMSTTSAVVTTTTTPKPVSAAMSISGEGKKRGRPKGSCNKPKPPVGTPGVPRPQVGRPRGAGHSSSYMAHPIRPFKRDFSGIRFRRRWSDDGLDSSHIPNEVYFGDVPVSMEILFNYYDTNSEREKLHSHQKMAQQTPGNVTLVYSSSDSSSDDSSDSDSSDTENEPVGLTQPTKRGPGRPRGSKTINRRSDGQQLSSGGSPGDKPPGITDMKKFLKAAGIDYDYNKLVDGATSNKDRVARLMGLLHGKGLVGPPSMEACRALYDGPPPRRRGPKPGTKRTPRPSISLSTEAPEVELTPSVTDEESRRVTRGQTSGKPRQRIVISSDEEDSHTPLSKLRTMRQ
ncbi:uncharacterized protein LOC143918726 isoform X9 [Arctopsyche grandis]|uniref:uncharacterized protein LOC143918726 isoform X9 n=1 Tax=Arctopsyche grandis TaxID=121162 RepID=UPI00406D861B